MVLDSAREIDNKLAEHFSREFIGENEIMISQQALYHLDIDKNRKE